MEPHGHRLRQLQDVSIGEPQDRQLLLWDAARGRWVPHTLVAGDLPSHTHPGSEITSQVADADTVDGQHAAAFAPASHTHPPAPPAAHAASHASGGSDPVTPAAIGAALASHTHGPGAITPQGAGSGLDADRVDGQHASAFALAGHTHAPSAITPQGAGSGLDADLVDGRHANDAAGQIALYDANRRVYDSNRLQGSQVGHGTSQIPFSDLIKNIDLHADLLDGRHAGNGNGEIPVNNGALNTNLNADLLRGATWEEPYIAAATAEKTLTTSLQDIPGAAFTVTTPGTWLISAVADLWWQGAGDNNVTIVVELVYGIVPKDAQIIGIAATGQRMTLAQQWTHRFTGGTLSLKLRARKLSGSGTSKVMDTHTTLTAFRLTP